MFSKFEQYEKQNDDMQTQKDFLNNLDDESLYELFKMIPLENITLLDDKHLSSLIKHDDIKFQTLTLASKYFDGITTFNYLLNNMSSNTFLEYLDQNMLDLIIKSNRKISIIKAILFCGNANIINVLKESIFIDYVVNDFLDFRRFLGPLPEEVIFVIFQYIEDKYPHKLNLIIELEAKNQLSVIEYLGINKFYSLVIKEELFIYLDNQVITFLIEKNPFYSYFLSLPTNIIISLVKQGVILPESFSRNKILIEKLMTITSPNEYRLIIDRIIDNSYTNYQRYNWRRLNNSLAYFKEENRLFDMDVLGKMNGISDILAPRFFTELFSAEYVEEARERYYDNQVSLINSCLDLLPEYYDFYKDPSINKLESMDKIFINSSEVREWFWNSDKKMGELYKILYDLSTKKLLEILVDRFYKDITYNFLANLSNVVAFFSSIDLRDLNLSDSDLTLLKQRLARYDMLLNFYLLSRAEQLELYNSFDQNKSYTAEFYDDFNLAKNFAYDKYNEVVFNLERDKNLINEGLSNQYNVPIYELKGDDYYTFSHVTSIKREESYNAEVWESTMTDFLNNPFIDEYKKSGLSISLNSSKKMEGFRPIQDYVTFGFCHLIPKRIAHVHHTDSYSAYYNRGIGMYKINELYMPDVLIQKTQKYNEILYQEISEIILDSEIRQNYEELVPDYLLCCDHLDLRDIQLAKRLGIPILIIYTQYYVNEREDYVMRNRNDEYITCLNDILAIKTYKNRK